MYEMIHVSLDYVVPHSTWEFYHDGDMKFDFIVTELLS